MAPVSAMAPAGAQSTTLSSAGKPLKRGMSLRRASTQCRPRNQQQQLPSQFLQPMQGQLDGDEDEDTIISCHPSFQTHRHRDRQSHYIDPRQQMLHLPDSQRPASSRSHMRDWNRQRERSRSPSSSKKLPSPDSLLQQPQSEYYSSLPSSTSLTSEEFEALPPTVRRKRFMRCLSWMMELAIAMLANWVYRTYGSLVDGKHDKCRNSSVSRLKGSPATADLAPSLAPDASLSVCYRLVPFTTVGFSLDGEMRCHAMQCNAMHLRLALTNSDDKPMAPERLNPSLASQHTSVMALVGRLRHSTSTFASEEDIWQPGSKFELASDSSISGSHQQPRVRSSSAHLYPYQADTLHGRPADNGERRSNTANSHHKSIILDATDEAFVKINKRHTQVPKLSSHLNEPFYHEFHSTMSSSPNDEFTQALAAEASPDSIIESFRWLDESDDLDLRLDDYQSSPKQGKKKRMPFPRHLSISKLSFGRPSSQLSRPATKGSVASPALSEQFVVPSLPSPSGHFRRRSRALSLMSPNKGQMPDDYGVVDSAPSHYQDPEARMKLRVYLASPHKFDEAVEFGFPSLYDTQGRETSQIRSWSRQESYDKIHSSTGDDAESLISDPTSPVETVSPRTPESLDHPPAEHSPRLPHEGAWPSKVDYAQAPASSREMTLRMTLTRPDLRADEEQMYGWQKPSSSKGQAHDGSAQPRSYSQASNPKDNIERQFAIMDQEAASSDNNMVKRFWNRVRRS
ncbi:uncharacterized protein Triagg1_337 [Trichoderma aggressivum f. europaeum]|uniref:Mucin n=1 Tax=Trichoderma aggressivum f. europaeum TaxID=173218 RepID=A0AAE1IK67_9HYPO|nr:hypothetical protein Triagg1_337 [Trichoderma aggressivum f. europaeum]